MDITLGLSGEIPVFALAGRLDAVSAPELEERLGPLLGDSGGGNRAVFDCSALTYVSSAGLRVFLLTQRTLGARGGGAAFASLSDSVRDLFLLAGLDAVLPIASSVDEAAARLVV